MSSLNTSGFSLLALFISRLKRFSIASTSQAEGRENQSSLTPLIFIGGQAYGPGSGIFGRLITELNYPGDNPNNLKDLTVCPTPSGQTDKDFILNLIKIASSYNNKAIYDPFPDPWGFTYNSNSYVSGLLKESGAQPPSLPGTRLGYSRPLPFSQYP